MSSKRANKVLKRLQRKRKSSARSLYKERIAYVNGDVPPKGYNKLTGRPVWSDGVKSIFPTHATGKLSCSSPSRAHDFVLSRGGMFYRCSFCRISTYSQPVEGQAA